MKPATMHFNSTTSQPVMDERVLYDRLLDIAETDIVELGCGDGTQSINIATTYPTCRVTAYEVDETQLEQSLARTAPANLEFRRGGAEQINQADNSVDIVMMFKSLHHVPLPAMDDAMLEINRILRPGGLLYISEPIFDGAFNEVIRLFHDEQAVREAAFDAERRAVESGTFELAQQTFFLNAHGFADFAEFEQRLIGATYADHKLDDATYAEVKRRFMEHMTPSGAHFESPMRVDLFRATS